MCHKGEHILCSHPLKATFWKLLLHVAHRGECQQALSSGCLMSGLEGAAEGSQAQAGGHRTDPHPDPCTQQFWGLQLSPTCSGREPVPWRVPPLGSSGHFGHLILTQQPRSSSPIFLIGLHVTEAASPKGHIPGFLPPAPRCPWRSLGLALLVAGLLHP